MYITKMATGGQLSRSVAGASEEYFEFVCSPCEKESMCQEAEAFCEDCSEYLCKGCLKFHNRFEKMKGHSMLDKDGMRGQGHRKPQSVPTEKCEKHHGRLLDTYCGDHDEICCVTCVALKHTSCQGLVYLCDAAEGIATSNEMRQFNVSLNKLEQKLNRLEKKKEESLQETDKDAQKSKEKILKTQAHIVKHLNEIANASIKDIEQEVTERKSEIKKNIEKVTKMQSQINDTKKALDPSREKNEVKLFVSLKRKQKVITTFKENTDHIENSDSAQINFNVTPLLLDLQEQVKSFGGLDKGPRRSFEKRNVAKPGRKYDVRVRGDNDACNITSICQIRDGTIILSDCFNKKLKRLDSSYNVCETLSVPGDPIQICCSGDNELLVALHLEKEIHSVAVTNKMSLKKKMLSVAGYNCKGVACLDDTIFVACSKFSEKCLKLFNRKCDLIKTVETDAMGQHLFKNISYLLVSQDDGTVFISDGELGVININRNGNVLATYTGDCLKYARNLCAIDKDILLVCDYSQNSVVKITRSISASTVFLGQGDGITKPQSVLVDRKSPRLLIGMENSPNILVFETV